MSTRKEEFVPDGHRLHTTVDQVVRVWRSVNSIIPAQYAAGTAEHETDYTLNEVDTEPSGFVSKGIFQLSDEESLEAGHANADLLTLIGATTVLSVISNKRLDKIVHAAKLGAPPWKSDVFAYIALAHNQGLGACLKSIQKYGLDWAAYKARNPNLANMARYGDDVISGGRKWRADLNQP